MEKKIKWILGIMVSVILVTCLAGYIYIQFFFELDFDFEEGTTNKVNIAGWEHLEGGMTQEQVIELLGDASAKWGPGSYTKDDIKHETPRRWEYNWTIGWPVFGAVHRKAYVVYFDKDEQLTSWREPLETNDKP